MGLSSIQGLPRSNYRRLIDEYATIMPGTVLKLKFLRKALDEADKIPLLHRLYPPFGEIVLRHRLIRQAERLNPGSNKLARKSMQRGGISSPHPFLWSTYRYRYVVFLIMVTGLIWSLGNVAGSLNNLAYPGDPSGKETVFSFEGEELTLASSEMETEGIAHAGVKETTSARGEYGPAVDSFETSAYQPLLAPAPARKVEESVASRQTNLPGGMDVSDKAEPYTERDIQEFIEEPIWLVEKTQREETYSNGLEIVTSYQVDNTPRQYVAFSKTAKEIPDEQNISSEVRGILYHASESDLVPFEPEKNRVIKLYSTQLRQFLCRKKLYNYLIDRFGRVFRIVRDDHAAFHAGNSVWADDRQIFLNLNHAFLGICFESKGFETADEADSSQPKMAMTGDSIINDAQVRAGRELTDWLRFRYRIAERNCVTHGITSIYPEDGLIGYHLDLAYGFPFQRFGLRDKYKEPLPSIVEYGFTYDQYFLKIFQGRLWPGILLSENLLKRKAELAGMSFTAYRESLKQRFTHDFEWQEERLTENIGN